MFQGFEQSFWAAVYGTSVGRTKSFGVSAKQLTGLCGVFIGVGEIIGLTYFIIWLQVEYNKSMLKHTFHRMTFGL